jgi:hypothetical protein
LSSFWGALQISVINQALNRIINKNDWKDLKSGKVNGVRTALSECIKEETVINLLLKKFKKMKWGNEE